jgi:cytosine/adenosine deaminase-related metal-dependent hydrolase
MLDDIGFLSPRLTLAHCVWARPDELEMLADRGVTIAVNTGSNLHLHSGIAPVLQMKKVGCSVALGIDSKALDDDDDSLRELRLSYLLHAGTGFDLATTRHQALHSAVSNGRFAVANIKDGGAIEAGGAADMLLLDWAALDEDGLLEAPDPVNMLFSRATACHISELIIGGQTIVKDRRVLGVDLPAVRQEVLTQIRSGMTANGTLALALAALDQTIARHHLSDPPCC